MTIGRRCALLLSAAVVAAVPVIGAATPAAAEWDDCWSNGTDMISSLCGRNTFILDPGRGHLLDRAMILQHRSYYESRGFSPNFLWYAPQTDREFRPDNTERWSGCVSNPADGQTCSSQEEFHVLLRAFRDDDERGLPIHLPTLSFGRGFIALTCGNFSEVSDSPVPVVSGYKFHDKDRDGVRDAGEPGLAGWTMTLHRDRSDAGQGTGMLATTVTNADGYYEFRLDGHLPGGYAVTEESRADWTRTTEPERRTVQVGAGVGAATFAGNDFGNEETKADAVKVSFAMVDPPVEMRADTENPLRIRAVLENRGPAPVIDVRDTISASGPPDCVFRPAEQAVTRRLVAGQPVEIVFEVGVTCTEPSFHPLEFANALSVITPGVTDPDQSSNHRTTGATIAVIDESDVAVAGTALDCAARTYVDERFSCTVTATLANGGDYGPPIADVSLGLSGPPDCVLTPDGLVRHDNQLLPAVVASTWNVVCADRSYHDFAASARVELDHLHVVDPDPSDNDGAATDRVEVFEHVDLSVADLRLTCTERQYQTRNTTCVSTVTVANTGPATSVLTRTTVGFTAPADCTVTPAGSQQDTRTLDNGSAATFTRTWTLVCTEPRRHTFATTATIAADEPHPEDVNRGNDVRSVLWQPDDIKPRSYPSSVNIKKEGLVPVAVLSTMDFNALAQVDPATLAFGATGTESSLVRCATQGEDVNDDGLADLVCHFDTNRTGLTCGSTTATLAGYTRDGRRFEGQDDIKITGC